MVGVVTRYAMLNGAVEFDRCGVNSRERLMRDDGIEIRKALKDILDKLRNS